MDFENCNVTGGNRWRLGRVHAAAGRVQSRINQQLPAVIRGFRGTILILNHIDDRVRVRRSDHCVPNSLLSEVHEGRRLLEFVNSGFSLDSFRPTLIQSQSVTDTGLQLMSTFTITSSADRSLDQLILWPLKGPKRVHHSFQLIH